MPRKRKAIFDPAGAKRRAKRNADAAGATSVGLPNDTPCSGSAVVLGSGSRRNWRGAESVGRAVMRFTPPRELCAAAAVGASARSDGAYYFLAEYDADGPYCNARMNFALTLLGGCHTDEQAMAYA